MLPEEGLGWSASPAARTALAVLVTWPGRPGRSASSTPGCCPIRWTGARALRSWPGATQPSSRTCAAIRATLVFRARWEWVAVHGTAELAGPGDTAARVGTAAPGLLRDIYRAAGGSHPDLAEYDRVMAAERRTAVLLRPDRFTTNPPGTEHQEHG